MNNTKEAELLISLIEEVVKRRVNEICSNNYVYCRRPVLIKTVSLDNSMATIAYPSDPNYESRLFYPNRSSTLLTSGQKAYLLFPFGQPDQGWIESNSPIAVNNGSDFGK